MDYLEFCIAARMIEMGKQLTGLNGGACAIAYNSLATFVFTLYLYPSFDGLARAGYLNT